MEFSKLNRSVPAESSAPAVARRTHRRALTLTAKVIFAVLLTVWMVRSGRLDFRDVMRVIRRGPEMALVAGLCYAGYCVMAFRWRLLLVHQDIRASMRNVFALTMIGALFNTLIPGAVSGDVVKAYYIAVRYPEKKAQAVTTIFLDRVVGLTSLLILSVLAGAWNFGKIAPNGRVAVLYWSVVVVAFAGVALLAVAAMMSGRIVKVAEGLAQRFLLLKPVVLGVRTMAAFYNSPLTLAVAFSVSFVSQFATCFAFYFVGLSIGAQSIPLSQLLFVIPLGLTAMALPIAPAGLGVGQVVFFFLFSTLIPGAGPIGASMATIYQLVYVLVSLTGLIFYFTETSIRRAVATASE